MTEFKTPKAQRFLKNKAGIEIDFNTPLKIPASPFLQKIGYGTGEYKPKIETPRPVQT